MIDFEKEKNNSEYKTLLEQNIAIDLEVLTKLDIAFSEIEKNARVRFIDKHKALNIILSFIGAVNRFKIFHVLISRQKRDLNILIDNAIKHLKNYHLDNKKGYQAMVDFYKLGLSEKKFLSKVDVENTKKTLLMLKKGDFRYLEKTEFKSIVYDCISLMNEKESEVLITTRMLILFDAFATLEKYLSGEKYKTKEEVKEAKYNDEKSWNEYRKDKVKTLIGIR